MKLHPDLEMIIATTDDVMAILHTSRFTFYTKIMKDPSFPKPFKIGERKNGWLRSDIYNWINDQANQAKQAKAA